MTSIEYGALMAENAQLKADLERAQRRAEYAESEAQRLASELTKQWLRSGKVSAS